MNFLNVSHFYPSVHMKLTTKEIVEMEDNYTSYKNCVEKNFGKTFLDCNRCYSLQNMTDWDMSLHSSIVSVIMVVSLFENFLLFILLLKYKELRHRTSVVSLSLLMANTGFVCLPFICKS